MFKIPFIFKLHYIKTVCIKNLFYCLSRSTKKQMKIVLKKVLFSPHFNFLNQKQWNAMHTNLASVSKYVFQCADALKRILQKSLFVTHICLIRKYHALL